MQDWVVNIGADATYAAFVEEGTQRMSAQPYLYPAIMAYLPLLEQMILAAIDAATSSVSNFNNTSAATPGRVRGIQRSGDSALYRQGVEAIP